MDELIRIKPIMKQVSLSGVSDPIVNFDFMLHDLIVSNNSTGQVTIIVEDFDENKKVIVAVKAGKTFNHNFSGWSFWRSAKLKVVKENGEGIVDVSVGVSKIVGQDYSVWRL